ncbi:MULTISPECIES: hypothetical protein [unclassified Microcoleus]|uniref:hypothetical protein n=1 Tax=unclassified Microcoleus TaxID=2642155 RepID=UPI002FCF4E0E
MSKITGLSNTRYTTQKNTKGDIMTNPTYRQFKKQDTYRQLFKRDRILIRKLREITQELSCRIESLEAERDCYKKQLEVLDRFLAFL